VDEVQRGQGRAAQPFLSGGGGGDEQREGMAQESLGVTLGASGGAD